MVHVSVVEDQMSSRLTAGEVLCTVLMNITWSGREMHHVKESVTTVTQTNLIIPLTIKFLYDVRSGLQQLFKCCEQQCSLITLCSTVSHLCCSSLYFWAADASGVTMATVAMSCCYVPASLRERGGREELDNSYYINMAEHEGDFRHRTYQCRWIVTFT